MSDAAGPSRHDAGILVAETTLRCLNLGMCGVAFWSLMNPNTIDGWWRAIAIEQGQLVKAPHLYPIYRLLSRYARPGCGIYPLRPEVRESPYQHVWATALRTPKQQLVLLALNDHICEVRNVTFVLPKGWAGRVLTKVCKDGVRQGEVMGTLTVSGSGELHDRLTPMSLQAYVEET